MKTEILISGFGGQGIMSLGKFLSRAAASQGLFTTWFPSYGAEVRGGTAYCYVKISDKEIGSPLIEKPDVAIIFNQPSFEKFNVCVRKNGIIIANKDLLTEKCTCRKDIKSIFLPFNQIAAECGDKRVANTVALGVFTALLPRIIHCQTVEEILRRLFAPGETLEQNIRAFRLGMEKINSTKESRKF